VEFVVGTVVYGEGFFPYYWTTSVQATGSLGVATSTPYDLAWTPTEPGSYYVWARATNQLGFEKESARTDFQIFTENDAFSNATVVASEVTSTNIVFNSLWSSVESGEPVHDKEVVVWSRWWKWTPSVSRSVRLKAVRDLQGLPLDVFVGDNLGDLRLIASNKDRVYVQGLSGAVRTQVKAGRTCFVRVSDTHVPLGVPMPPGLPPGFISEPPPPEIILTIEPASNPLQGELDSSFFVTHLTRNKRKPLEFVPGARVFLADGRTPVTGSNYRAQLYAGPGASRLEPVGSPQAFFTPDLVYVPLSWAGVIIPQPVFLTNVTAYHRVFAQVRVWDSNYGETYEAAAAANGGQVGESAVLKLVAGSEETGPAPLSGLKSFRLH
jgi:hypothetical protein